MQAPDKIFVGTIDAKKWSIVGKGYPYAKEYISIEAVMRWFEQYKENCKERRTSDPRQRPGSAYAIEDR